MEFVARRSSLVIVTIIIIVGIMIVLKRPFEGLVAFVSSFFEIEARVFGHGLV